MTYPCESLRAAIWQHLGGTTKHVAQRRDRLREATGTRQVNKEHLQPASHCCRVNKNLADCLRVWHIVVRQSVEDGVIVSSIAV